MGSGEAARRAMPWRDTARHVRQSQTNSWSASYRFVFLFSALSPAGAEKNEGHRDAGKYVARTHEEIPSVC